MNVRKSLRGGGAQPNVPAAATARKTLMQRKTEHIAGHDDNVGLQISNFDLFTIDREVTQLAYIHLTLEHLMSIENKMNISNGTNQRYGMHFKQSNLNLFVRIIIRNLISYS